MLGLRTLTARSRPLSLPSLLRLLTPTPSHLSSSHLTPSLSNSPCLCSRQPPHRTFTSSPDDDSSSSSSPPPLSTSNANMPPRPATSVHEPDSIIPPPDTDTDTQAENLDEIDESIDETAEMDETDENMNEIDENMDENEMSEQDDYDESVDYDDSHDQDRDDDDDGEYEVARDPIPEEPPGANPHKAEAEGVKKARRYIQIEKSIEWLQTQPISSIKSNLAKLQSDPFYQKWLRGKELESTYPQRLEQHFEREDYRLVNRVWPAVPIVHKGQQITATPTQRALHAERITSIDDYLKYHRTKLKVEEVRKYRNVQKIGRNIPARPEYDWVRRLLDRTRDDLEINPNWTSKQKVNFIKALHPRLLNYARDEHARKLKREADRKAAIEKAERQARLLAEANARDEAAKEKARQARAERRAAAAAAAAKSPPPS